MGKKAKAKASPKPRRNRFCGKSKKHAGTTKCKGGCDRIGPDQPPEVFELGKPVCTKCLNYHMVQIDGKFGRINGQMAQLETQVAGKLQDMVNNVCAAFGQVCTSIKAHDAQLEAVVQRNYSKTRFYSKRHHKLIYDSSERTKALETPMTVRTQMDGLDRTLIDALRGDVSSLETTLQSVQSQISESSSSGLATH